MSIFTSAKAKLAAQKLAEEQLYEFAAEEIAANNIRPGLWAKAIAESDGDDAKAKARYIKLRVEAMKAEADLHEYTASQSNPQPYRPENPLRQDSADDTSGNGFGLFMLLGAPVILIIVFILAGISG